MKQTKQYEYVDLGLPSGLKWAKCNVGAEKETDFGDYFMWGSTTPNTNTICDWEHAPFNNGSNSCDEEYFTTHKSEWLDDNGNLKPEFDAATQIMGSDWRMPTKGEIQELLDNTDNEWDTINGVKGWKFISKIDMSKYIFFPAAGDCYDGSTFDVGSSGNIWSSSLDAAPPYYALYFGFLSDCCAIKDYARCDGQSVRGVIE